MGKKIFSGVQPTGNLHLGNYLGAIKNFVELNNDNANECIFCVVDLHAITVKQDPKELKKNTIVFFFNSFGSCLTVMACKSTTQKIHSFALSLFSSTKFFIAPK